jgi:hypothetical protein
MGIAPAAVPLVIAVATAVTAGAAAGYTAYTAHKQANFQAAVAQNNAQIAENNAKTVLMEGQVAESAKRAEMGRKIGAALAEQGASGVDVNYGSPSVVRKGLFEEGELDALTIRHNAMAKAIAYKNEGKGYNTTAQFAKIAGRDALIAGGINVASSFVSGANSYTNTKALQNSGQIASVPKG